MDWLFHKYTIEKKDDMRCLLMKAFYETLKLDKKTSKLKDYSLVK